MFYQIANIEASKFKGNNNWALLLDENNFVAEGSGNTLLLKMVLLSRLLVKIF